MLKPVLESEDVKKIGQNIKYEMLVLRNHGVRLGGNLLRHDARGAPA